ncbi:TetR/AcrR family transcriptional regulator [Nonomuraea sp. K274]|uniref:TetR/AcrR family transcriptional regulator n=1 Tax=Nonomuraea cypriaca TaxID=1187855 RepID=A0A931A9B4_9ACTN|nr:TetR/AcrR family transcriptional regulator [Nonomuraea cypriaca]MBF8187029.1 TetR/AcrR family transcriptional regulator [Nonomuraea cypriaca]
MARTVNEEEHAARRETILREAHRLIRTKGYQQMTIQDVLAGVGMSKGALYHYFDSKPALLEALVERMMARWERALAAATGEGPALERLQRFLAAFDRVKVEDQEFLTSVLPVMYSDDNALVRQKSRAAGTARFVPLVDDIVRGGVAEGVFDTPYPDRAGLVVLTLIQDLTEAAGLMVLEGAGAEEIARTFAAYGDVLERALGAPAGSLRLMDGAILADWLSVLEVR